MAFGDQGIAGVNVYLGVVAQKFIRGLNGAYQYARKVMAQIGQSVRQGVQTFKQAGAATSGQDSFLSPEWFKFRAKWFVQLRAFWTIWQQLSKAVAGAFEFEQQMATVRAITQATNEQFEALRAKAIEVGRTTRFSAAEAAEGMVVMAQAGLTTTEIIESLTNVANLATATLYGFKETASLIVTVMRAWSLQATDTQRITDVLATSINSTKLTMDALARGFNYVAGVAPDLNVNIEETTSLLGVLANRGLSASTAATSLRAVMASLLSPTDKMKRVLNDLGLTYKDIDPRTHEFVNILGTLKEAGFGAAEAYRAFQRRAAAGATILIQNQDEVKNLAEGMNQLGRASQQAEIQLNTVQGQMKQFEDNMIAVADKIQREMEPSLILMIKAMKSLATETSKLFDPLAKAVGKLTEFVAKSIILFGRGKPGLVTEGLRKDLAELNSQIEDATKRQKELRLESGRLQDVQKQILQLTKDAVQAEAEGRRTDLIEKATKFARERALITGKEFKEIMNINGAVQQQAQLMKLVNKEVERRLKVQYKQVEEFQNKQISSEAVRNQIVQESGRNVAERILELKKELKINDEILGEQEGQLSLWQKIENGIKTAGEFASPTYKILRRIFSDEETDKARELTELLDRFYTIIRSGGPEAEKLVAGLGKEFQLLVQAIKVSGDFKQVFKTMGRLEKEGITPKLGKAEKESFEDYKKTTDLGIEHLSTLAKTTEEKIKEAEAAKALYTFELKEAEADRKRVAALENNTKNREEEARLTLKIKDLNDKIAQTDIKISGLKDVENTARKLALQYQFKLNEQEKELYLTKLNEKELAEAILILEEKRDKLIESLALENALADARGQKDLAKLETEKKILDVKKEQVENSIYAYDHAGKLTDAQAKQLLKYKKEQRDIENDITINLEKQYLATNAVARNINSLDIENVKTIHEAFNAKGGIIDTFSSAALDGFTNSLRDITTLFSAQRQEAEGLEGQLATLNQEYQQAITEGDIARAQELEAQMSALKDQISDLKNPLVQLGESFKSFARLVIEELQKVILKMLAVKAVETLLGFLNPGAPQVTGAPYIPAFGAAHGGVLPSGTFASFRRFAKGGVTSGMGAAILGDNPSGKELVIPSENIKGDSVSGTVRDSQQPINIINILTEQDIANAMAKDTGQRVIINTIGKDIGKRGPTYRAMKA